MVATHIKTKLSDKVESSWRAIQNHRAARKKIFDSYIGDSYGLSGMNRYNTPLNTHAMLARSLILHLAAHAPKLLLNTNVGPWKPWMEGIELQASNVMREQRFGFRQQRFVLDALLYSPGILMAAEEWRRVRFQDGDETQVLQPLIRNIDFSDFVWDTSSDNLWDADFIGCKRRLRIDDIHGNPTFRKMSMENLRGLAGWGMEDQERLFFEQDDVTQEYKETITAWYIYDRWSNQIKIWPVDNPELEMHREVWEGHANGPFHFLDFLDVPNHPVGLSPLCLIHNLSDAINRSLSKAIGQADRSKNVWVATGGDSDEIQSILDSRDGSSVYVHGDGVPNMLTVPGPDPQTMATVPVLYDLFNLESGNINQFAGLRVSAPTATQGVLNSRSASAMIDFLKSRTNAAVLGVAEAIVGSVLRDEVTTEVIPVKLADGTTAYRRFTPEQRKDIDSTLVEIDIDTYSMQYRGPEQRLQNLMAWWTGVALPGFQIWQQQGGIYDLQALNEVWAKYQNMPEINDIALYAAKPASETSGAGGQQSPFPMRQSPVTQRTNIRQDRGGEQESLGGQMAKSLLGAA